MEITNKQYILTFGKYKQRRLSYVFEKDPKYVKWAHENVEFFKLNARLLKEVDEVIDLIEESKYDDEGFNWCF
jgi:hypothetical protein